VNDLRFRGLVFGVWVSGLSNALGFRLGLARAGGARDPIEGLGFRISSSGFRVSSFGFQVSGFGFRVPGSRFRGSGVGFQVFFFITLKPRVQ